MSLPTSVQSCASGRHGQHVVTLVDELTAFCAPPCEAASFHRVFECRHVRAARAEVGRKAARAARTPRPLDLDREFAAIEMEAAYAEAAR